MLMSASAACASLVSLRCFRAARTAIPVCCFNYPIHPECTSGVNAGEILQRLAGVKVQQRQRNQEAPRNREPSCFSSFIP